MIITHAFGYPFKIDKIMEWATKNNLIVLEVRLNHLTSLKFFRTPSKHSSSPFTKDILSPPLWYFLVALIKFLPHLAVDTVSYEILSYC